MSETPVSIGSKEAPVELFCENQIATVENPAGNDCVVWLLEGKTAVSGIAKCPYLSAEHAQQGTKYLGVEPPPAADGVCQDFAPRDPLQ